MRLIDADELIEHAWRDKLDSRELIVQMIATAPTIKEIPTKIPIDVFEQLISQEPVLDKINKMKSEIADSLEFWDYSPNNNLLAKDMLETLTNFWGDIKAESEET